MTASPALSLPLVRPPAPSGRMKRYCNVIYALVMHDIKNRFFGSGLGQIAMVLWPFVHIVVLLGIYVFTNRPHPYGESIIQYSAVSVFPFIAFNYTGRWIVLAAAQNKTFLQYPIIKPLDILVARAVLETASITMVGILLITVVVSMGFDAVPPDPAQAIEAILATLFLAVGFGFLNAPFAFILPLWTLVITLFIVLMWLASGVLFVTSKLPPQIRIPLSYNPLLHCVEWMRIAYYPDYPTDVLDKQYIVGCALTMLTLGLILMRLLRRFF